MSLNNCQYAGHFYVSMEGRNFWQLYEIYLSGIANKTHTVIKEMDRGKNHVKEVLQLLVEVQAIWDCCGGDHERFLQQ